MGTLKSPLLGLLLLVSSLALPRPTLSGFERSNFPKDFYFGTSTAAFQVEGGASKNGRGPCVWDAFSHDNPERILDGSNGDVAVDFYNRYREDFPRMKKMGLNAFRFSISWSRVIPHGQIRWGVNEEGITFYNNLITQAVKHGLEPFVTIFHWDTPQALEDKYGGFLSRNIVDDYRDFAELCFQRFGDRVRYWITLNEPWAYAAFGYARGDFAPGRCSAWVNRACKVGNSATEPYLVTHHLLLAHAAAVQLYREKYKETQDGKIGVTLVTWWMEPFSNKAKDRDAAKRALDFNYGWYLDPLTYGDYPRTMRDYVKDRLPIFTTEDSKMVKGSIDFLGLNYYSARYVQHIDKVEPERTSFINDDHANLTYEDSEGKSIGPMAGLDWLRVAPFGIRYLLNYTKDNYQNPNIFITENGLAHDDSEPLSVIVNDTIRIDYYDEHLGNVSTAMKDYNVTVSGFFAWSFMDNFEWSSGYTKRFGLTYIDYKNNLKRIPKASLNWFTEKLTKGKPPSIAKKQSRPILGSSRNMPM
ncbi:hypothetical protein Tsubulata_006660 [Turnera subulata]|uniref:Beta-glucosidase n=1 Tax=Turnera subulata TaxID=218843 RepID=A0A9Q0J8K7_9ROSI|nr:hypothetical protein Tsubulata_006660 [Turnera subulata]